MATFRPKSQEIPVGADGIDFDENGTLYVANCGDGLIEKFIFDATGRFTPRSVLTSRSVKSADGIFYDRATRQIYVADILANAIQVVSLDGKVTTLAQDATTTDRTDISTAPAKRWSAATN